MPGTNAGTGQPIHFKCPVCVKRAYWTHANMVVGNYTVTGRVKPLASGQRGRGGGRVVHFRVQYQCQSCGHVGWSRHKDVARKLQARFDLTDASMEGLRQYSREINIAWANKPNDSGEVGLEPRKDSRHGSRGES